MLTFEQFVLRALEATSRLDLVDVAQSRLANDSLGSLGFDSLDIVILGSVLADLLPPGLEVPEMVSDAIVDSTLGELYHFYAATTERSEG
jgi:hypothetical protein